MSLATTASLLLTLSRGVVAQTPQTTTVNPLGGPGALRGPQAAREQRLLELLAQKKAAAGATQIGVEPDATGGGPGPAQLHFTSIDVPGANATYAEAINTEGTITGYYSDTNGGSHGLMRSSAGKVSTFDVPGDGDGPYVGTFAYGINDSGVVTGYSCSANFVFCPGFVRDSAGKLETFDAPGDDNGFGGTYPFGINDAGTVTGSYEDANFTNHAFVRDPSGTITEFDPPDGGYAGFGTFPAAINSAGTVSGCYVDTNGTSWGFVRAKDGVMTTFDAPSPVSAECLNGFADQAFGFGINPSGATTGSYWEPIPYSENAFGGNYRGYIRYPNGAYTGFDSVSNPSSPCCTWTWGIAINEAETVVGFENDYRNTNHGFLRTIDGSITSLNFPPTAAGPSNASFPTAINANGWAVGWYQDAAWVTHGFLWKP